MLRVYYLESISEYFDTVQGKNLDYINFYMDKVKDKIELTENFLEQFYSSKNSDTHCNLLNDYSSLKKDLAFLEKAKRRANGYKKITTNIERNFDSKTYTITFPRGTKKKFMKQWLENNGYPVKTKHYPYDQLCDCTGEVNTIWVTYKSNVVVVEKCYDC